MLIPLSCKAQIPIYGLETSAFDVPNNSYIKDINNDFNKYTGTWKFENTTQEFTLNIGKKTMYYDGHLNVYKDLLYGEYQYKENGVTFINTLPNFTVATDPYDNAIQGRNLTSAKNFPICHSCPANELRVKLSISDPDRPWVNAYIVLRYVNNQGVESLVASIFYTQTVVPIDNTTPVALRMPIGEYTLMKQ